MRGKTLFIILCSVLVVLLSLSLANAQSYRENAAVSSVYVYRQMVDSVDAGQLSKVLELARPIEAILAALETNLSVNIKSQLERAVASQDREKVKGALHKLIFYDIQDIFRAAKKSITSRTDAGKLKEQLKLAYLDYLIVSPEAKRIDFGLDREVRKVFNELLTGHLAAAVEASNPGIVENDMATIEGHYRRIFGI
ncbi:MAG: hypothetical protein KJ893_02365 [Candidatus Omnitrophica bacterium]|nr:hypothetical protein [Candidatus Omnitrophota bacterium]MBU4478188.1 hypothetical protein [Candidatus Omnitrophota bacterium]MCG2703816.1 hypothetical protein [Candidatus Omnitrophota bacterium]